MSGLLETVSANVRSRKLLSKGQRVLVAVSGGVDSMVLLDLLQKLAKTNNWRLTVAHLNHQLRGRSSNADERLVRQAAKKLRLPIVVEGADVRKFARAHKLSLEMAARKLRHDFLARTAARLKVSVIALAHHADDQVELFFLRLLRGSGGEGLSGMKWMSPSPSNPKIDLVRPLLAQPKSALLEHAATNKIRFREDATNASVDIQRNLIRHELLPLLRRKYQPALDKTILRVIDIIGAETDFVAAAVSQSLALKRGQNRNEPRLSSAAARAKQTNRRTNRRSAEIGRAAAEDSRGPENSARFDALPLALQRRCLHVQLIGMAVTPSYDLIEELRLHPDQPVSVPASVHNNLNRRISRDAAGLVHVRQTTYPGFSTKSGSTRLDGKSDDFEFDGVRIGWRRVPGKFLGLPKSQPGRELFDADKIGDQIMLRHWQAGDRFQPIGMNSTVKLQDLFTNAKITRAQRHSLIVALAADGGIFWVEGMRISERYKLTKSTIRRLHWRWRRL